MAQALFDLDVLRTFATGMRLGSYAKAADRLGRSPSAVSAQLKKLEAQAGTALFRKAGRGLALTEAGETLLAYAHRMIELNEEANAALRGLDVQGWVRLGLQEEFGEALLPQVLGRFARSHPRVRIEACMMRCAELRERLSLGQLDLALVWETGDQPMLPFAQRWLDAPLQWIGPSAGVDRPGWWGADPLGWVQREPLPLVLLDEPCPVRRLTIEALDRAGIPWRHAFTSASLAARWAASSAGLGLTVRTALGQPAGVQALEPEASGLPRLPSIRLVLYRAQSQPEPLVEQLAQLLRQAMPTGADRPAAPALRRRPARLRSVPV